MFIILTALLASTKVLPLVDQEALELQARAEALQPRTQISRPVRTQPARRTATQSAQPVLRPGPSRPQPQAQAPARPVARRASGGNALDLAQITTICRAAGEQADPAAFIGRLSSAYSLSADDALSLRSSCAAYLAGRADARRSGGTY